MKVLTSIPQKRFESFGVTFPDNWEVVFMQSPFTADTVKQLGRDADAVLVGSIEPFTKEMIDAVPGLKIIHAEGVGFDKIDYNYAKTLGIPVCNNKSVNNGAVAEHTIGLIMSLMRRIPLNSRRVTEAGYTVAKNEFYAQGENELAGKTVGFVGFGAIGREVARKLSGWDVNIIYYDAFRASEEVESKYGAVYTELDELCRTADIVSVHVPVLPSTIGMFNDNLFSKMKPTAFLINTARGEIVDNDALYNALAEGKIAGAGLDVVYPEPMPDDHILRKLPKDAADKLIITTHVAGVTKEAFKRMLVNAVANIRRVEAGEKPVNIVNENK